MLVGETVAVAFQSIRANKLRSVLTMLGIIIGVGAVITMVALGTGAQKAVEERIAALGRQRLHRVPGPGRQGGIRITDRASLSTDDYEALRRDARLLTAVVPEMQQALQVKYGNQNININVVGTTPNYVEVRNYTHPLRPDVHPGRRRRPAALRRARLRGAPACSASIRPALIGQTLQIRGITVRDHRHPEREGRGRRVRQPRRADPHPAADRAVPGVRHRPAALDVGPGGRRRAVEQGMVDIERVLRREHKIRPGGENDFPIRNQQDILATQQETTQVFTTSARRASRR